MGQSGMHLQEESCTSEAQQLEDARGKLRFLRTKMTLNIGACTITNEVYGPDINPSNGHLFLLRGLFDFQKGEDCDKSHLEAQFPTPAEVCLLRRDFLVRERS